MLTEVKINFDELSDLSDQLLHVLGSRGTHVPLATAALVLAAGRISGGRELDEDAEMKMVQDVMTILSSYHEENRQVH